jgi:hypothetical protein
LRARRTSNLQPTDEESTHGCLLCPVVFHPRCSGWIRRPGGVVLSGWVEPGGMTCGMTAPPADYPRLGDGASLA